MRTGSNFFAIPPAGFKVTAIRKSVIRGERLAKANNYSLTDK